MSRKIFENEIRKIALVVLPYAGGSSQSFSDWHSKLEDTITLNVLDYGGHGRRIKDSLPENFDEMVSDIEIQLQNISNESTFLFGHSMGGLVCAYAAANMYNKFGVKYAGIIISCCMAPEHFSIKNEMVWSDEKLINYLKIVRNVPLEVIESKEFRRFILPAIKNDFCI